MYFFWNRVLSYFAKPNFIVYDEWFDNDLQKTTSIYKNKKTENEGVTFNRLARLPTRADTRSYHADGAERGARQPVVQGKEAESCVYLYDLFNFKPQLVRVTVHRPIKNAYFTWVTP